MKFRKHRSPANRSLIVASHALALAQLLALPVLAGFSGSDSLASESSKWAGLFHDSDRGRLIFQNSHLEYLSKDSDNNHKRAYLKWTPNKGDYNHDWFVQVYAHRGDHVSIGVVNSANRNQGYTASIVRGYRYDYGHSDYDRYVEGFSSETLKGKERQHSISSATGGYLRIHFDSKAKTLTASWKTRLDWNYFEPFKIDSWGMDDSSHFTAVLIGGGYADHDDRYPYNNYYASSGGSHSGYFSNFKCGPAAPLINLEQPAYTNLNDGISKRSFGTATVGGRGRCRIFTIRNNGTAKLRGLKIMTDGIAAADFRISNLSDTALEPGGSTTFRVVFKPKAAGTRKAAMHIQSNDPGENPFDLTLTGMGVK